MFHPGTQVLHPLTWFASSNWGNCWTRFARGGQSDLGQKCPSLWHPTNAQLWIKTRSIWPRSPWDWDPGSRMEGQGAKSHGDSIQRLQQFIDSKVLPKWFYSASVLSSPESNVFLDVASQNSSTVHNSFWKCIYLVWRGPITPWNTLSR